ncbi:MAG TPA: sigma-70 family RNA polymerase sigma factor [Nannocystaceae bacterium]|nr:sigma-70 family RNA polymerase sigma factor [Nannocystaceae bacterium]
MRSDGELLSAWRDGDKPAGQELYARYFPVVYRFLSNKVGQDLADLVQRTFLACTRHRERLRDASSFRSFLLVVARNELADYLRDRYHSGTTLDVETVPLADLDPSPSQLIGRRDEHRLLLLALRRIPIELQHLVELHYFERLSGPELAEALEIPEGTVRSRLRRALALVRAEIERLARSPELVESTMGSLDAWAAEIREISDAELEQARAGG